MLLFYLLHRCKSLSLRASQSVPAWRRRSDARQRNEIGVMRFRSWGPTALGKLAYLLPCWSLRSSASCWRCSRRGSRAAKTRTATLSLNMKHYFTSNPLQESDVSWFAVFVRRQSSSQPGHTRGFLLPQSLFKDGRTAWKQSHCDETLA